MYAIGTQYNVSPLIRITFLQLAGTLLYLVFTLHIFVSFCYMSCLTVYFDCLCLIVYFVLFCFVSAYLSHSCIHQVAIRGFWQPSLYQFSFKSNMMSWWRRQLPTCENQLQQFLHNRGGPRLEDIFFPILPENLTSHPVRKTKIFSCERQKKNWCESRVLFANKIAIVWNRVHIWALFLAKR